MHIQYTRAAPSALFTPRPFTRDYRSALVGLFVVLGALPLVVLVPAPLADWASHLARVWVTDRVLHGDAFWQARYVFRSLLIPNAVLDGGVLGLMRLGMSVNAAGVVYLLVCYGAFVAGFVRLSRLQHLPAPLAVALATTGFYTGNLIYGLVNFITGIGVAMFAASYWLNDDATIARRFAIAVIATPAILFCHVIAAMVFAGLCGCYDLFRPLRTVGDPFAANGAGAMAPRPGLLRRLFELAPATLSLLLGVLAFKLAPTGQDALMLAYSGHGGLLGWGYGKLQQAADGLSSANRAADAIFAAILAIVLALLWRQRAAVSLRLAAPVIALAALPIVAPFQVGEGLLLDTRLFVLPALIGMALLPWAKRLDARWQWALVAACLSRPALLALAWSSYAPIYDQLRAQFAQLPRGSTLLTAYSDEPPFYDFKQPPLWNIGPLAVSSGVFVPSMFAEPTQQPLAIRPVGRPRWLWDHNANARTPENLAAVRAKARRYCAIDPRSHLFILHTTQAERFSVESECEAR